MSDSEAQDTSQQSRSATPCYRLYIGGLWAFVVEGGWCADPKEPKPCYPEVHVFAVNAARAPHPLCDHWPVLILDKKFLKKSSAHVCGNPEKALTASHREVLAMGPDCKPFDALVMPLAGRSVAFITNSVNTCVEVPDTGHFLNVLDLQQPELDAGPAHPDLKHLNPKPDALVNAKIVLNKGTLLGHRPTPEEIEFRSLTAPGGHKQKYCRQAIWELETHRQVSVHVASCTENKVDIIELESDKGPVCMTVSNYCEAKTDEEHSGDADDVRALYELSEHPILETERQYPYDHNSGSSDDFCPPGRLAWE